MSKRSQKPPVGSSPETLDVLLAELSEHGLNFVVGQPLWQRLIARGPDVIPALLDRCDGAAPFKLIDLALQKILEAADPDQRAYAARGLTSSLSREIPPTRRIAAIKAFSPAFARDAHYQDRLLNIALDPAEDLKARTAAFQTLAEMHPTGVQAERLLGALEVGQEHGHERTPLSEAVFLCLRRHALQLPGKRLRRGLEPFLTHASPRLRKQAIELIGAFGDVDMIEHLLALPDAQAHRDEILSAVAEIGKRPINLLSLRPDAFEAVMSRILKEMGYLDVETTRYSGDGGIDAVCYALSKRFAGMVKEKIIVQYKRYTKGVINEDSIREFAGVVRGNEGHRGLFVTTSDYTQGARDFAAQERNLDLISGPELVERLNEFCKTNRYLIRIHG